MAPRRRRVTTNKDEWQFEFDRGVREHSEWIHNEKSRLNVAKRKRQAGDKYEEAYFFGVLTGSKRAHPEGWPAPKNWKGQPCIIDNKPSPPPNPNGLMRRRKKL